MVGRSLAIPELSPSTRSHFRGGVPGVSASNPFLPIRPFIQNEHPVTWKHERRLASAADATVTWQTGLFYYQEQSSLFSHEPFNPGAPPGPPGSGGSFDIIRFAYHVDTRSKAAFAQGSVKLGDTSKITAGARHSKDDVTRVGQFALFYLGAGTAVRHVQRQQNDLDGRL